MASLSPQQLSALVDQDIDPSELDHLLEQLGQDDALRACWGRYHLIGNVLRGEPVSAGVHHVAEQVSRRLDQAAVAAPDAPVGVMAADPLKPKPSPRRATGFRDWWPRVSGAGWFPLTGAALTGMAILSAILLFPDALGLNRLPERTQTPALAHSGAEAAAPSRSTVIQPPVDTMQYWSGSRPQLASKLNRFLLGHQERISTSSLKGYLPYATLVSYQTQP
ncbi:sigma-E factor negative regulatory protein [Rhabdochromatium marinum]|uniref:sigma-E factor negative regulatory protein n=1 Tax=Rhabdochromatium marinum TaxID=48729 RepID=UPI001905402C|nr:sigma-E factor negative regulatory protein [Rhabdochromatium marinum]